MVSLLLFLLWQAPAVPWDTEIREKPTEWRDNGFAFCNLMYTKVRSEPSGNGWNTDFPLADRNLGIRFAEVTTAHVAGVKRDGTGEPAHWVVDINNPYDDSLFTCPFIMTADVGTMGLTPIAATRLREYLLKGGFLWVDDFWGDAAWRQWQTQMNMVFPPELDGFEAYPIVDIPDDHFIFSIFASAQKIQVPNIGFWKGTGGDTSERREESEHANYRMIQNDNGHIMVLMTHNTDIGDTFEQESDPAFFLAFVMDGYRFGINVLVYVMSH